jgi:transcriptional regulator with XRE-family HTH domain
MEPKAVGALIRKAREAKKLTQEALGRLLGVEKQSISNWETGKVLPKRANARTLAVTLDIPLGLLLGNHEASTIKFVPAGLHARRVPILSPGQVKLLAKGEPIMAEGAGYADLHVAASDRTFAMEVMGTEMQPEFAPGHIVVADPSLKPVDGDFVLYDEAEDGPIHIRMYRKRGEAFDLVALDPALPTLSVTPDKPAPRILAVIVEHVRTFRRHIQTLATFAAAAIGCRTLAFLMIHNFLLT